MTEPFCVGCDTFARDIRSLDYSWAESEGDLNSVPEESRPSRRVKYVQENEGTFNVENGHFLCDGCYIDAGMPTAPNGWITP